MQAQSKPSTIREYQVIARLNEVECPSLNQFIHSRNLPVLIDEHWEMYYREPGGGYNPSFLRSLQEIRFQMLRYAPPDRRNTRNIPVSAAAWESGLAARDGSSGGIAGAHETDIEERKANEKVQQTLDHLIESGASDMHLMLNQDNATAILKMRVNGLMVTSDTWTHRVGDAFLRSIWNSHPQLDRTEGGINNGSFYHTHRGPGGAAKPYMVRVTETPEVRGLKFVARLRDPSEIRQLQTSGYTAKQQATLKSILMARAGLISINGPTNSGKSTTQSAILASMPKTMNIIEIGDPVETQIDGVTHIELKENYEGGKLQNLKDVLGSTVRQDPDMLALTEMRDTLTATAAVQLTSQGKLVITTMHTDNFITAFGRLKIFQISPDEILAPEFLRAFVSQKLLPKLCPHCCLTEIPDAGILMRMRGIFGAENATKLRYHNPDGCGSCMHTGISSRVLVAEVVEFTTPVIQAARDILEKSDPNPWIEWAEAHEIITIHQHARQRCLAGEIDPSMTESEIGRFDKENLRGQWIGKQKPTPITAAKNHGAMRATKVPA